MFEYARVSGNGISASYDDVKDSIIGKVVQLVAPGVETRDRMLRDCRDRPTYVVARAEDVIGLRERVNKMLRATT